jgi:hypothetical protein
MAAAATGLFPPGDRLVSKKVLGILVCTVMTKKL